MGFREEIIKAKRRVLPYIWMSKGLNRGAWAGPDERLYSSIDDGTYINLVRGTVLSFGTFSRALTNAMFSLEIPGIQSTLLDPTMEWRSYATFPYDNLLGKWLHYLLRVHDDGDDIYDASIAQGQIISISFPTGRKVEVASSVMSGEILGAQVPRRVVTLDHWPRALPENVGRAVPILYGRNTNKASVALPLADKAAIPRRRWVEGFEATWEGPLHSGFQISSDSARSAGGLGMAIRGDSSFFTIEVNRYKDFDDPTYFNSGGSWERLYIRLRQKPTTEVIWYTTHGWNQHYAGIHLKVSPAGDLNLYNWDLFTGEVFWAYVGTLPEWDGTIEHRAWVKLDLIIEYAGDNTETNLGHMRIFWNGIMVTDLTVGGVLAGHSAGGYGGGYVSGTGGLGTPDNHHYATTLGNTDQVPNDLWLDVDDWVNSEIPRLNGHVLLNSEDFLCGSKIVRVKPLAVTDAHTGWTGTFREAWTVTNSGASGVGNLERPGSLFAPVGAAVAEFLLDGELMIDADPDAIGVAGMTTVLEATTSVFAGFGEHGTTSYSLNGWPFADQPANFPDNQGGLMSRLHSPSGRSLTLPKVTPITLRYDKDPDIPLNLFSLYLQAELVGVFGEEDWAITPVIGELGDTRPSVPRTRGPHNQPYPHSPWAIEQTIPPVAPVRTISGTYVGNGTGQDIPFEYPVHFVIVRAVTLVPDVQVGGAQWWSGMLGSHDGATGYSPWLSMLENPNLDAHADERYLMRVTGGDITANRLGVTFQYVAFCDPGSRVVLNGGHPFSTAHSDVTTTHRLMNPDFLPEWGFFWSANHAPMTAAGCYVKSPGHVGNAISLTVGGLLADAIEPFSLGQLVTRPDYLSILATDSEAAHSLWRRSVMTTDVVAFGTYIGNDAPTHTITPDPVSSKRPLLVMVIGETGFPRVRDPSHVSGESSYITAGGASDSTPGGIVAGGVGSFDVDDTLNLGGFRYHYFVLWGGNVAGPDGWSANGEFAPMADMVPLDGFPAYVPVIVELDEPEVADDDEDEDDEEDEPAEDDVPAACCLTEEFTPGRNSNDVYAAVPTIRWSDHFTGYQGNEVETFYGGTTDAWMEENYSEVRDCTIEEGGGPDGGNCAVSKVHTGSFRRGVGPQTASGPGAPYPENDETDPARFGRTAGQFGSAGIVRKMTADMAAAANVMEVTGRSAVGFGGGAAVDHLLTLVADDSDSVGTATHLVLFVGGLVARRNGAKKFGEAGDVDSFAPTGYQTAAMHNILYVGDWQTIEMRWKISSTSSDGKTVADGWVEVKVDHSTVIFLQEITFNLEIDTGKSFWEGVSYGPQGRAACVYITDRLYCAESIPAEPVDVAAICAENVGAKASGALECMLVDTQEVTQLVQAAGITGTYQTGNDAPRNAAGYVYDYESSGFHGGRIPAGVKTYYRVSAVNAAGQESSWSDLIETSLDEDHSDIIVWDAPDFDVPKSFRVYQMTTPDLVLNPDDGTLREETFYVKQVPGTPQNNNVIPDFGPRQYQVKFWSVGDGAAMTSAEEQHNVTTTWLVAGHSVKKVTQVYALLDSEGEENPGGLNLWTGEKEPITFVAGPRKLTQLEEGVDYTVQEIVKNDYLYTVIVVTRDLRNGQECTYTPITCNYQGIMDDNGKLITDGPLIVRHFLLNWVFNSYRNGAWFQDVEFSPGILDTASFVTASTVAKTFVPGGYKGAVALVNQQEVRQVVLEALGSFNLDMYYRNGIGNNSGAWTAQMFNPDIPDTALTLYTAHADIIQDSFSLALNYDLFVNNLSYKAGPFMTGEGWLISGKLISTDSETRFGTVEREFLMPWTRDIATAVDVAQRQLRLRAYPMVMGSFQTKLRGVTQDLGSLLAVTHPDGLGSQGWTAHPVRVIGHDLDLDNLVTTIRFMSMWNIISTPDDFGDD